MPDANGVPTYAELAAQNVKSGAFINLGGAQDTKPSAAIAAFKTAAQTGVDPSLGMANPEEMGSIAGARRDGDLLDSVPSLARFAARSPAHVAATREDWPNLAKVAAKVDEWNTLATVDFGKPAEGALNDVVEGFRKYVQASRTPAQSPLELIPGLNPSDRAAGQVLRGVTGLAFSPFAGLANMVARPLSAIPQYTVGEDGTLTRVPQEEAQRKVTEALLTAVSGLGATGRLAGAAEAGGAEGRLALPPPRPTPRPGTNPEFTDLYKNVAEADAQVSAQVEERVAASSTQSQLPQLTAEFLEPQTQGQSVWVDPEAILKLYSEGHEVLPQFSQEIGAALNDGRDVEIPLSAYWADVSGKPYAEALRAATRFREWGVSLEEARGLGGSESQPLVEEEAPEALTPPAERPLPEDMAEHAGPLREMAANVDSAVEEVFQEQALRSLFDPKALGLNEERFARYDNMLAEAKAAASERVLKRAYDQIRRERTPEWKDQVARHLAEVEEGQSNLPVVQAARELQYSEGPRGEPLERPGVKLSRKEVVDSYGQATADGLPRSMFGANGMHPDDIAHLWGYTSGMALLSDLLDLEGKRREGGHNSTRDLLKAQAQEAATTQARSALGYDISPQGILEVAREEAVLPQVEDFLAENLRDLAKEVGLPFDPAAVELQAKLSFDALQVKSAMNVRQFERGMWKTGEKALKALEKGDWPAAFVARQQQLINFHQLKMSHFLAKKFAQGERKFNRLAKNPTIPGLSQPFLNQLHAYLPQWGFRSPREPQELVEALGGVGLEEFVGDIRATNADFPGIPEVRPSALRDLSVDDYWKVRGFIYAMDRYGRELQSARSEGKREDFNATVEEAISGAPPGKPPERLKMGGERSVPEKVANGFLRYDAAHRKVADMVEWFDRGNPLGLWAENTSLPMYRGADLEGKLHREAYGPVFKAWEGIPDKVKRGYNLALPSPFSVGGAPVQAYRKHVPMLALYTGTEESLQKAAEGYGVTPAVLLEWINTHITPEEVAMVEEVWARFAELAPLVSEQLRALTGQGLRYVQPTPVRMGGRSLKGGYWPISYDTTPGMNPDVLKWEREREASLNPDGVDELFAALQPNKGFAEERTGYVGPVDVDIHQIGRAFNAHIKYASYARAVSDVRKFIYDPRVAATIERVMGPEYLRVIPDWLGGVVKPYQGTESLLRPIEQFFNWLGRNFTTGTLALSYGTLVAQSAGVLNSIAILSDGNALTGVVRLMGGYSRMLGEVGKGGFHEMFERSEFMRQRYGALEQNMTEALLELERLSPADVGLRKHLKHLERIGFQAIGWAEFISVSGPTWLAAEQKALGMGMSPEKAVEYANRMVTKSQGGGRRVDLAAVQRAQGMWKLMYAFQSYFNQQYQLGVDLARNVRGAGIGPPAGGPPTAGGVEPQGSPLDPYSRSKALLIFLAVFILSGIMDNFLRGKKGKWSDPLFNFFRPMFGVNTLANGVDRHLTFEGGKLAFKNTYDTALGDDLFNRAGEGVMQNLFLVYNLAAGKRVNRPVQTVAGLGQLAGIPGSVQVGRTGEYLHQLSTGQQRPRSGQEWVDIYLGLTGGPRPEQAVKRKQRRSHRR